MGKISGLRARLLWAIILVLGVSPIAVATEGNHQPSALYSIDLHDTTSFQGLIDFSIQNQIAIGVMLSPQAGLCTTQRRLVLKNVTAQKIMDGLLRALGLYMDF
jgi:hypothetical protein